MKFPHCALKRWFDEANKWEFYSYVLENQVSVVAFFFFRFPFKPPVRQLMIEIIQANKSLVNGFYTVEQYQVRQTSTSKRCFQPYFSQKWFHLQNHFDTLSKKAKVCHSLCGNYRIFLSHSFDKHLYHLT